MLPRHHHPHAGFARARRDRRSAEQQAEQRDAGRGLGAVIDANRMAADDMAQFVREHALHLFGGVRGLDQPGKDIDILAAGDECVDATVAEQVDTDLPGLQPCRDEQRIHHVLKQRFGFGVAQDRLRHRRSRRDGQHREQGQDDPEQRAPAACPKYRLGGGGHHLAHPRAAHLNID